MLKHPIQKLKLAGGDALKSRTQTDLEFIDTPLTSIHNRNINRDNWPKMNPPESN